MGFKSYCWSIGTTSFRVDQLNYKNECQLRYLNELFISNPDMKWDKTLQTKYFDLLVSKDFIEDYDAIKDKDAREKTSGLADIGLVYRKTRHITPIGDLINKISLSGDFSSDNILEIPKDSYVYLLQFLKYQINDSAIQIRPFVALLYMLSKLEYLTREEFTYLYPTCLNNDDVLITKEKDINNPKLVSAFPDIVEKTNRKEDGLEYFIKVTDNINKKNEKRNKIAEKIFSYKQPIVTYIIMAICIILFILMELSGGSTNSQTLLKYGANLDVLVKNGEYYRLFTCIFLHIGIMHLLCNMYSLYIIGRSRKFIW